MASTRTTRKETKKNFSAFAAAASRWACSSCLRSARLRPGKWQVRSTAKANQFSHWNVPYTAPWEARKSKATPCNQVTLAGLGSKRKRSGQTSEMAHTPASVSCLGISSASQASKAKRAWLGFGAPSEAVFWSESRHWPSSHLKAFFKLSSVQGSATSGGSTWYPQKGSLQKRLCPNFIAEQLLAGP